MTIRPAKTAQESVSTRRRPGKVKVSVSQERVPRMPHERDESADSQGSEPRKIMKQAASDLRRGLQDTDRGPQMTQLHKKLSQ